MDEKGVDILKNERKRYVISAAVSAVFTFLILALTFTQYGLYPFGDKTLSWCDMDQQVVPILAGMKNADNWIFNWGNAGGMGFLGVIFFFTFSPFSAIVAFYDAADIMLAVNVITILKIMMCAVSASVFFRKFFPKLEISFNVILSTLYAVCGYSLMMYQILSWLDTMYLFPLLLVAMKVMYDKGNMVPYAICLSAVIITCFYLSWMILLFIIFASWVYIKVYGEERKGKYAFDLLSGSVCAALISMPVLAPSFLQYLQSARGENTFAAFFNNVVTNPIETKLPYIMCAAVVLPCLFIAAGRIRTDGKRLKVLFSILLILLVPMFVEKVNLAWHTFSYQAFPYRFGYMTVLILLAISATVLEKCEEKEIQTSKLWPLWSGLGIVAVMGGIWYSNKVLQSSLKTLANYTRTLWGNKASLKGLGIIFIIFAVVYGILLLMKSKKLVPVKFFCAAIAILTVWEGYFNSSVYIGSTANSPTQYNKAITAMNELIEKDEDEFFRVKCESKIFDVNWVGAAGYASLGHYTSLTDEDYLFGMKKLGYSGYWMELGSYGSTAFMDSLLCNKVILKGYASNVYKTEENEYFMPLGVVAAGNITQYEYFDGEERCEYQNAIYSAMFGDSEKLFTKYEPTNKNKITLSEIDDSYKLTRLENTTNTVIIYNIKVDGKQTLYFDCFNKPSNRLNEAVNGAFKIYVNGRVVEREYPAKNHNGILELGTFEDETVVIKVQALHDVWMTSFGVWGMDMDKLAAASGGGEFAYLKVDGTEVYGSVASENGGELFLAIPYSEGFSARVNGERVPIKRVFGSFMAVEVEAGENEIEISYSAPGFTAGIIAAVLGIIMLILMGIFVRPRADKIPAKVMRVFNWLLTAAFIILVGVIYIMPFSVTLKLFLTSYS